jgi:hypothetical protein
MSAAQHIEGDGTYHKVRLDEEVRGARNAGRLHSTSPDVSQDGRVDAAYMMLKICKCDC